MWKRDRDVTFRREGDRAVSAVRSVLSQAMSILPSVVKDCVVSVVLYVLVHYTYWGDSSTVGSIIQDNIVFLIIILIGSKCDHQFEEFTNIRDNEAKMAEAFYTSCDIHAKQLLLEIGTDRMPRILQTVSSEQSPATRADNLRLETVNHFFTKAHDVLISMELCFMKNTLHEAVVKIDDLFLASDPRSDSLNQYKHEIVENFRLIHTSRAMSSIPQFEWYLSLLITIVVGVLPPIVLEASNWWIILGTAVSSVVLRTAIVVFREMGFEGFWSNHTKKEEIVTSEQFTMLHKRLDNLRKTFNSKLMRQ